jgi:hypothetical protein
MQHTRVIPTKENKYGTKNYWRGRVVSCYDCHNGPSESDPSTHPQAVAQNVSTNTTSGASVAMTLSATGSGTMTYRIVSQPAHGSVGLSNNVATYFAEPGYVGTDQLTFAAWNGWVDSNLATGTVAVAQGPFSISAVATVPLSFPVGWPAPFGVTAAPSNLVGTTRFEWNFGDGSAAVTDPHPTHVYAMEGTYSWFVISLVESGLNIARATNTGTVVVTGPEHLDFTWASPNLLISWPAYPGDALLEWTAALGPAAPWLVDTNRPNHSPLEVSVQAPAEATARFYRLRKL